jgi:hypothetical protein
MMTEIRKRTAGASRRKDWMVGHYEEPRGNSHDECYAGSRAVLTKSSRILVRSFTK